MHNREEIARRYGFESFARLLEISDPLPKLPGDEFTSYIARHPNGYWFLWDDAPPGSTPNRQEKPLYQIVGVARDGARTVIMAGMKLDVANAAREAMKIDPQYVWVMVEREPD